MQEQSVTCRQFISANGVMVIQPIKSYFFKRMIHVVALITAETRHLINIRLPGIFWS